MHYIHLYEKNKSLNKFIIRDYFDEHQSFIEVTISDTEKKKLLSKFKFEDGFQTKLQGRVYQSVIKEAPDFKYHVIEHCYGPYGYILIAVNLNNNILQVFEEYGN